jgi:uncharacterized protein
MPKIYEIRDPVYGFIAFNEWERDIINHPVFQRLRRIRQLALTEMVYPGAVHTRFEHSLGVMHLATNMFDTITRNENNVQILHDKYSFEKKNIDRYKQLIRIAALLHDVGHAPFSHASEAIMEKNPETGKSYNHEDYTIAIIRDKLKDVINDHAANHEGITANEVIGLIKGTMARLVFWKTLISSQLDADRGDYLLRDAHHCGVKYGVYDVDRLLVTISLGEDPETKEITLGVKEDGWHTAESLIIARYLMHTQVYFHKTRVAYNIILREAIKETRGSLPSLNQLEQYVKIDDYDIWNDIKNNKDKFWCKSILSRNHIRQIFETNELPSDQDKERLKSIKQKLESNGIDPWEENSKSSWYKLDKSSNSEECIGDKEGKEEIMIILDKNKTKPLSEQSNIAKYIDKINQIRLYVKPDDREKANDIVKEILQ